MYSVFDSLFMNHTQVLPWKTEELLTWQLTVNALWVVVYGTFTGNMDI